MWRETDSIGVRFLAPEMETQRESSSLELENVRLRARVRDLMRRLEELGQDPNVSQAD